MSCPLTPLFVRRELDVVPDGPSDVNVAMDTEAPWEAVELPVGLAERGWAGFISIYMGTTDISQASGTQHLLEYEQSFHQLPTAQLPAYSTAAQGGPQT